MGVDWWMGLALLSLLSEWAIGRDRSCTNIGFGFISEKCFTEVYVIIAYLCF